MVVDNNGTAMAVRGETVVRVPLLRRDGAIQGYAVIDAADAEWVGQWTWRMDRSGYAVRGQRTAAGPRTIRLHRELLGLKHGDGFEGDHINRDRLDDRRVNLRPITKALNAQNTPSKRGSTSAYRGVSWNSSRRGWIAQMMTGGKKVFLGCYSDETEAASVARAARQQQLPYAVD